MLNQAAALMLVAICTIGPVPARAQFAPLPPERQADGEAALAMLRPQLVACQGRAGDELCLKMLTAGGLAAAALRRWPEFDSYVTKALAMANDLRPPGHADIAAVQFIFAKGLDVQGRFVDAEPHHRAVVAHAETRAGEAPAMLAEHLTNLGENLYAQERPAEAEPVFRRALALNEQAGADADRLAKAYNNLAASLSRQGSLGEAELIFRRVLALMERRLEPGHPDIATALNNLAVTIERQGRLTDAEALFRQVLALREARYPAHSMQIAQIANNLAYNLSAQGRYRDAEPLYRRAVSIQEAIAAGHPELARSYQELALNLDAQGRAAEAEPMYRSAMRITAKLGPTNPNYTNGFAYLGLNLLKRGIGNAEVRSLFRRAEDGAFARIRSYGSYPPSAQRELRQVKPLFLGHVQLAWKLAAAGRAVRPRPSSAPPPPPPP